MYLFVANSDLIGIEPVNSEAWSSKLPCTRTRSVSRGPLNAMTCDAMSSALSRARVAPGQCDRRRNQICATKLKSHLLKDACCLQFRAAISNALHRLSIQLARLNDPVRLQQLDIKV